MLSFSTEIEVKTTMKQHLWTVKPLLNIWIVRLEQNSQEEKLWRLMKKKLGKIVAF